MSETKSTYASASIDSVSIVFLAGIIATSSIAITAVVPAIALFTDKFALPVESNALIAGVFAAGYAVGQLLVGLIADRVRQRQFLIVTLSGFTIISGLIVFVSDFTQLLVLRFFQALFVSACPIIGRAAIRGIGKYEHAARKLSGATTIFAWAPVITPIFAGYLVSWTGSWQSVFILVSIYGLAILFAVLRTPDFSPQHKHIETETRHHTMQIPQSIMRVFQTRSFIAGLMSGSLLFAGFFSFIAMAPLLISTDSRQVGFAISIVSVAYALGGVASRILMSRFSSTQILFNSVLAATIISMINIAFAPDVIVAASLYALCTGIVIPHATMLTMKDLPELPAMAVAIVGCTKMGLSALLSFLATLSLLMPGTLFDILLLLTAIGAVAVLMRFRKFMDD